jgi:hypothetical protein
MALSKWRSIPLLVAVLCICARSIAQENQATPQTVPQPGVQAPSQSEPKIPSAAKEETHRHSGKPCVPVAEAAAEPSHEISHEVNHDICISAHVYDLVELPDGTRFLDVCPRDVPDDQCRFTLLSLPTDRDNVGDLRRYRNQNIEVRGTVHSMHGRMGIVISHMRQFNGGPEKFRPNPRLLKSFNGQSDRMPVRDPNLASSGHHRSFMNTREQEPLPSAKKQ